MSSARSRGSGIRRRRRPLPGGRAADFLAAWLEHGTGGTCWPSSNGLHALVTACGFDVRRISASMFDLDDHNRGSLIVRLEGRELLVDSSIENEIPIPLERGVEQKLGDAVHPIRVEPVDSEAIVQELDRPRDLDERRPIATLYRQGYTGSQPGTKRRREAAARYQKRKYARVDCDPVGGYRDGGLWCERGLDGAATRGQCGR